MSQQTLAGAGTLDPSCDRATAITRSLLAYGAITGPIYVVVSLAQALTRDGFDLTHHAWSLLSNGDLGWIQITNFIVAGVMTMAFAVGLRRVLGATWAPRLILGYGLSLIAAGVFRADPVPGFPVGTPEGATVSWHGMMHFVAGAVGFGCLIAACLVLGRRFAMEGRRGWARFSRVTGVLFLAGFVGVAAGAGSAPTTLGFVAAILLVWAWLSMVAVRLYRRPL